MAVPATAWEAGMRITADRLDAKDYQAGELSISFTGLSSYLLDVVFPTPFPVTPIMSVDIVSASGVTGRFEARAISVTPTGWTLWVLITDTAEGVDTWVDEPVHWTARMPT